MDKKINTIVLFSIGYYVGQIRHGWTGLLISIVVMLIDFGIMALVSHIWKKYKLQQYFFGLPSLRIEDNK